MHVYIHVFACIYACFCMYICIFCMYMHIFFACTLLLKRTYESDQGTDNKSRATEATEMYHL